MGYPRTHRSYDGCCGGVGGGVLSRIVSNGGLSSSGTSESARATNIAPMNKLPPSIKRDCHVISEPHQECDYRYIQT